MSHGGERLEGNEWTVKVGNDVRLNIVMTVHPSRVVCFVKLSADRAEVPPGETVRVLLQEQTERRPWDPHL